jgi:hypothetical protein
MELNALLERLKMPHLAERLDTVCANKSPGADRWYLSRNFCPKTMEE